MKTKLSAPALFMYASIGALTLLSVLFLTLFYTGLLPHPAVMWAGAVCFIILYQFALRILFGEISKKFPLDYNHAVFQRRPFEKALYRLLHVRAWKDRVLTFDPAAYDLKTRSLSDVAKTMCKSEIDHWFNILLSLLMPLFALLWGALPILLSAALLAVLFDLQFIVDSTAPLYYGS